MLDVNNSVPGAVALASGSVDKRNTYVFQVIPQGVRESVVKTSSYWSTANGDSATIPAGATKIEPGVTPAQAVTLSWATFTEATDEAGMSRRYGGIHFARADLAGRQLGRLVADRTWLKANTLFNGTALPTTRTASSLTSMVVDGRPE
jgi:hypothetical protein